MLFVFLLIHVDDVYGLFLVDRSDHVACIFLFVLRHVVSCAIGSEASVVVAYLHGHYGRSILVFAETQDEALDGLEIGAHLC